MICEIIHNFGKKTCVRRVVLDKRLPLTAAGITGGSHTGTASFQSGKMGPAPGNFELSKGVLK